LLFSDQARLARACNRLSSRSNTPRGIITASPSSSATASTG